MPFSKDSIVEHNEIVEEIKDSGPMRMGDLLVTPVERGNGEIGYRVVGKAETRV